MRTKKEIEQAIAILSRKGDALSLAQVEILSQHRDEKWVFARYVSVPEAEKDEAAFFAARDAAQYLAGKIGIDALIPGTEEPARKANPKRILPVDEDHIVVSRRTLTNLLQRMNRLERLMSVRNTVMRTKHLPMTEGVPKDLISQADACKKLGCGKSTIKRWANKGLIKGYSDNGRVSYSLRELYASEIVKEYLEQKDFKEEKREGIVP